MNASAHSRTPDTSPSSATANEEIEREFQEQIRKDYGEPGAN
jgi:hypothetical protein